MTFYRPLQARRRPRPVHFDEVIDEFDTHKAREAGEEILGLTARFNSPHPERLASVFLMSCLKGKALPCFISARAPETAMHLAHYIAAFDGDLVMTQGPGKKGTHADNFVRKQTRLGSNFACFTGVSHPDQIRAVVHATFVKRVEPCPMIFAVGDGFDIPPDMAPYVFNVIIDPAPGFDPVAYMDETRCAFDAVTTVAAEYDKFMSDGKWLHPLGTFPKHASGGCQELAVMCKLAGYSDFSIN